MIFSFLSNLFPKSKPDIVLLVDGPNILRKAFNVDLLEIRKEVSKYGNIRVLRVYLDQYASEKLIEAMRNQGFEVIITTGDVDVTMAIEAMEYVLDKNIDSVALVTRDTDYIPVIVKAKARGKKTLIVATDVAFSAALRNTADFVIVVRSNAPAEHIKNP